MARIAFAPSRSAALDRLNQFVPRAGLSYSAGRNTDSGPDQPGSVSRLSPYVRRRLITEAEIIGHVLALHSLSAAETFVQEVLWRTYWKGWLELRPGVWSRFLAERDHQRDTWQDHRAILDAEAGCTGIEGFDDWARELAATGYLHNHARMWFASIWIFTLRLPWTLGADFFMRHLIDADAASNTLSWRWVAGLQTPGKTYLATTANIARYTNGRFAPQGLASEPIVLREPPHEAPRALPVTSDRIDDQAGLLLVTDEDLNPESLFGDRSTIRAACVITDPDLLWGDKARQFVGAAATETATRVAAHFGCLVESGQTLEASGLATAARAAGVNRIVTPYAPVGPVADRLAQLGPELAREGISLVSVRREWDERFWPHATRGFFPFKAHSAAVLRQLGLT